MFGNSLKFARSEGGAVPLEAIWVGLVITFLLAPTVFLHKWSETQLYASWMQRTSARNHALTGACNESAFIQLGFNAKFDDDTTTTLVCSEEETDVDANDRFWKKMEDAVIDANFPTLVDDLKDEGEIRIHNAHRRTILHRNVSLGEGSLLTDALANLRSGSLSWDIMVPSTDYYRWLEDHWKEGHDRAIWADLTPDAKKMFPNVFPSR